MIFQHTIDKVLSGEKTQTRRIVKPGDVRVCVESPFGGWQPVKITGIGKYNQSIIRWEIGNTYALQRGRGVKAEGRIRITGIRREDVRDISEADVKAEGFASYEHFVQTWSYMHDAAACREADKLKGIHICGAARTRPAERYQAWAITFELVKESDHASK